MHAITKVLADELINRVLSQFGIRDYDRRHYLFDYLGRLPSGCMAINKTPHEFCNTLSPSATLTALLDQHPNNLRWVAKWAADHGITSYFGCTVNPSELLAILEFKPELDIYILADDAKFLACACHEDKQGEDGQRLMYCTVLTNSSELD